MFEAKKARGATANNEKTQFASAHLLVAAGVVACVAAIAILLPSSDVEANKTEPLQKMLEVPASAQQADVAEAIEIAAEPSAPPEPPWQDYAVEKGDNLSLIFKRAGFSDKDIYAITKQAPDGKLLTRIFPGQTISFQSLESGELIALRHIVSRLKTVRYHIVDGKFDSTTEIRVPEARQGWASAEIVSSLFLAGQEAGLSHNTIMELANIFGGVIDFVMDPRKGDTIHLLYEDLYLDDEKFGVGKILAASFTNRGKTFNAYRYDDANGDEGYYNEEGVSMRKAFLLAPLDFTRISSNFNLRRMHPIYKTTKPHRGTDYAASRGTPVFAVGDGRVQRAGYSRANGNFVFISHGEAYVTKYLHLHKRNVKQGQRVSQSQVIGTVGSTGAATGPHLHYEFLVNGVHRNPRTIHKKLPKAKSLKPGELARFQQAIGGVSSELAALQTDNSIALNDSSKPPAN